MKPGWPLIPLKRLARFAYGDAWEESNRDPSGPIDVFGSNGPFGTALAPNTRAPVIVIGRKGSYGKVAFSTAPVFATDTTYFIDDRTTQCDLRWLYYAIGSVGLDESSQDSAVPGLSREVAYSKQIPRVPLSDQRRIAAFLDRETERIDGLIAKKQRLIDLCNEQRLAVIGHAVTMGVIGHRPIQGVQHPWLRSIPSEWQLLPLRRVVKEFIDYRGKTPEKSDDGVPLITAGAIHDGVIDHASCPQFIPETDYKAWMSRGFPELGDVAFTTEAPLGEVGQVTDINVAFAQRVILFKSNKSMMRADYLLLHFLGRFGRSEVESYGSGSTAEGIRADRLRRTLVTVPPLAEQDQVVAAVKKQIAPLKPIIAATTRAISLLTEYRSALITAAVTGQLDVTKAAPPMPSEASA